MTPGVMAGASASLPPSLSFHLKELMNAGLVTQERHGRNLVYRAAYDHHERRPGYLTENCCAGADCAVAASAAACGC